MCYKYNYHVSNLIKSLSVLNYPLPRNIKKIKTNDYIYNNRNTNLIIYRKNHQIIKSAKQLIYVKCIFAFYAKHLYVKYIFTKLKKRMKYETHT